MKRSATPDILGEPEDRQSDIVSAVFAEPVRLPIGHLRRDGGTQPRAHVNLKTVEDYSEAMAGGAAFPPVTVFFDGQEYWLADGYHRVAAAELAGWVHIPVEVRQGTLRDAVLYSVGTNATHGLQRSWEDKRRAVQRLLEDPEWSQWSDRVIADKCRVSHTFVANLRTVYLATLPDERPTERKAIRNGAVYTVKFNNVKPKPTNHDREAALNAVIRWLQDRVPASKTMYALSMWRSAPYAETIKPYVKDFPVDLVQSAVAAIKLDPDLLRRGQSDPEPEDLTPEERESIQILTEALEQTADIALDELAAVPEPADLSLIDLRRALIVLFDLADNATNFAILEAATAARNTQLEIDHV